MQALRSLLFAAVFYPGTVVAVIGTLPAAALGEGPLTYWVRLWTRFHYWCVRNLLAIRTRVEGDIPQAPVLIAAKHQAMYETLDLVRLIGRPAVVLKRELADIPGWGWAAQRYGCIPVDREGGAASLRLMLKAAKAAVAEGRPILIFPEGTRVLAGERPPLQPGFAGLYKALGLPVVPVALDSGKLLPKGLIKRSGTVTIRFGEPIPPGLKRQEIEASVHREINALET